MISSEGMAGRISEETGEETRPYPPWIGFTRARQFGSFWNPVHPINPGSARVVYIGTRVLLLSSVRWRPILLEVETGTISEVWQAIDILA